MGPRFGVIEGGLKPLEGDCETGRESEINYYRAGAGANIILSPNSRQTIIILRLLKVPWPSLCLSTNRSEILGSSLSINLKGRKSVNILSAGELSGSYTYNDIFVRSR